MALKKYGNTNWILSGADIVYERKPISQEIANGYFSFWKSESLFTDDDEAKAWIEDPTDVDVAEFKSIYVDPYNLVRANTNYTAYKELESGSFTKSNIDYFSALKGVTSSDKLYLTNTIFIPVLNPILIQGVKLTQNAKLSKLEIQFTEYGVWTIEQVIQ